MTETNIDKQKLAALLKAAQTAECEIVLLLPYLQGKYAKNMRAVVEMLRTAQAQGKPS